LTLAVIPVGGIQAHSSGQAQTNRTRRAWRRTVHSGSSAPLRHD